MFVCLNVINGYQYIYINIGGNLTLGNRPCRHISITITITVTITITITIAITITITITITIMVPFIML